MSIYTDCSEAARWLLDDWALRPDTTGAEEVFTELDVIFLAARMAGGYGPEASRIAAREASQLMGTLFRENLVVVRFGPVHVPGVSKPDYARLDTKIIYASSNGPQRLMTPNGTFSRVFGDDDPIAVPGRRLGLNRNDLLPWMDQDILGTSETPKPKTSEQREIFRLRAENAAILDRAERAEHELHRMRQHIAQAVAIEVERKLSERAA